MVRQCRICGKDFTTYKCLTSQGKGKYCSKVCSNNITLFKKGHFVEPNQTSFKKGNLHPKYKGWRYCGRNHRYKTLLMPNHPMADSYGYIREHRYIMSQKLGRILDRSEEVHHIDGNGLNNNPDNLILFTNKSDHLRLEHKNGTYKKHLNELHGKD